MALVFARRGSDEAGESDAQRREKELDRELEETELARRLRELDWPAAPDGVKQRGLREIMKRAGRD
jgi:hypothetical protein